MTSADEMRDTALKNALGSLTRLVHEKNMTAAQIDSLADKLPLQIDLVQCKAGLPPEPAHLRRRS